MHTMHLLGGFGAMNLDTDAGKTGSGQGGSIFVPKTSTGMTATKVLIAPKPTATPVGVIATIKQAILPTTRMNTVVPIVRPNTIVPVTPGRTVTVVPIVKAGGTTTTPQPVTIKTAPPAPGPIPTQGVVCIVPVVNVRAGGPSWAMSSCSVKGARQVSLAEALRLTGGTPTPPPSNYDPTAGMPPPVVLPTTGMTSTPPVVAPPTSVPDATPAEAIATVITATSPTAATVSNLPAATGPDIPTPIVVPEALPAAGFSKKGRNLLIAGGVLAVAGAIAAAVYGGHH